MNYRKATGISITSFLLFVVLVKFQNCAPANPGASSGTSTEADGEVRIIEDWYGQKVLFADNQIISPEGAESIVVNGLCPEASGQQVAWTLATDQDARPIGHGAVDCERGGFSIDVAVSELSCDQNYVLVAEEASGEQDVVLLRHNCSSPQ